MPAMAVDFTPVGVTDTVIASIDVAKAPFAEVSHWWKNLGDKTVVLLSADLLKDKNDHNM